MAAINRKDLEDQMEILSLLERAGFVTREAVTVERNDYGITGYLIDLARRDVAYSERQYGTLTGSFAEIKRLLERLAGPEVKESK